MFGMSVWKNGKLLFVDMFFKEGLRDLAAVYNRSLGFTVEVW